MGSPAAFDIPVAFTVTAPDGSEDTAARMVMDRLVALPEGHRLQDAFPFDSWHMPQHPHVSGDDDERTKCEAPSDDGCESPATLILVIIPDQFPPEPYARFYCAPCADAFTHDDPNSVTHRRALPGV